MFGAFSVLMCVYGGDSAEWFKTAVESVLVQSVVPNEIVLVVDGPVPDALRVLIDEYANKDLFNVIKSEINQGHGIARRIGLANCHNEIVAIMDSDDISMPGRFEKQLSVLEDNPDVDVVGGMIAEFVGDPSNIVGKRIVPLKDYEIKLFMKQRCPMNLVSVMFRRKSVEEAGGFIDWYCEEDYYLWLRMALAGMKFQNVDDVLVCVRVGEQMYQRRGGIKYFRSERKLQKYMVKHGIIGVGRYLINVFERFVLQVLMPNKVRGFVFRKFARSK